MSTRPRRKPLPKKEERSPPAQATESIDEAAAAAEVTEQRPSLSRQPTEHEISKQDTSSSDEGDTSTCNDISQMDDSIAVDCPAAPSEVIVQGRNVRKIRLKFPQNSSVDLTPRPPTGKNPNRVGVGRSVSEIATSQTSLPPSANAPLSLPNMAPTSSSGYHWQLAEQYAPGSAGSRGSSGGTLREDLAHLTQYSTNSSMDQNYKNSVISGIEYFERKNYELNEVKNRIVQELERVIQINQHLDAEIRDLTQRNKGMYESMDELKIKLDETEKENMRLQEQAVEQWSARVKADELYMELKKDSEDEMKLLKQKLEENNKEIKRLSAGRKEPASMSSSDKIELLQKMQMLEEGMQKLKTEKEQMAECNKKLKHELEASRNRSQQQGTELDIQYKRFLTLKKNFNDLREENEKLKQRLRSRQTTNGGSGMSSNTWPAQAKNEDCIDGSLRLLELKKPKQAFAAAINSTLPRHNLKPPASRHQRNGSDARSVPETLPPVNS